MARSMSVMLADYEEGRLDDEAEVAMLERAAVAFAHEKADEPGVALGHLVGRLVERDSCAVHHGEVGGERSVKGNVAVIENGDGVLR